jgi:hypothetical protein
MENRGVRTEMLLLFFTPFLFRLSLSVFSAPAFYMRVLLNTCWNYVESGASTSIIFSLDYGQTFCVVRNGISFCSFFGDQPIN